MFLLFMSQLYDNDDVCFNILPYGLSWIKFLQVIRNAIESVIFPKFS